MLVPNKLGLEGRWKQNWQDMKQPWYDCAEQ